MIHLNVSNSSNMCFTLKHVSNDLDFYTFGEDEHDIFCANSITWVLAFVIRRNIEDGKLDIDPSLAYSLAFTVREGS